MKIVLIFILLGLLLGAISGLLKCVLIVLKNNRIAVIITDFIFCLIAGAMFIYASSIYNFGIIRWYLCAFFALGYIIERKTIGKLFAKLFLILYNWLSKRLNLLKSSRVGKIIFK